MTPTVTPMLDPSAAYALWAETYPPHAHNALMLAEERAMLALLPQNLTGRRVLDVGCGTGRFLLHAQARGAQHRVGLDASWPMLKRAYAITMDIAQASALALPMRDGWADVVLCALTLGHVPDLPAALRELRRVMRAGGVILCSDFHPAGAALGWQRTFKANGQRYAVQHYAREMAEWMRACSAAQLRVAHCVEPMLDPADIPAGARFDPRALDVPVALVMELRA